MEASHEKNFFCKFCNKRYPCGKSLGGHIRIHLNGSSTSVDEEVKLNISKSSAASKTGSNNERILGPEAGGQSGYVLRENPKKTSRFVVDSSNTSSLPDKVCRECGKGFQSLKALCGHMACHSKNSFEDSEKLKELVMDSESDTETSAPSKRRRSKRMRYKAIGAYSSSFPLANGSLSSASSDIEQEQEDVAMCLMMLSRDSGFKGCFSSVADSSDNNSVVLEVKSPSTKLRISVNNGVNCVHNGNELLEMKKAKQREAISTENDRFDDSESGYFRNRPKKVESDVSVHGFPKNDEFKKHKVDIGSRFDEGFDAETGKRLSRFRRIKTELETDFIEEDGYDHANGASTKYDLQKRGKNGSYNPEFLSCSDKKLGKCSSLGRQRTSHKKTDGCSDSTYESVENSIDNDYAPTPLPNSRTIQSRSGTNPIKQNFSNPEKQLGSKRGKVHECPFCLKVFRSGQALGGHKRSHFVGGAEDRTVVIKQEVPEVSMPRLIDLNLPVPMEEEANGFMPW